MQIKDLINTINTFDVRIHFDNRQEVINKIHQGEPMIIYFSPIDEMEKRKYDLCSSKYDFVSHTPIIHVPDITVQELVEVFKCDEGNLYETTQAIISKWFSEDIPQDVILVIFIFLHEVGHWVQFQQMGNRVYEFINKDFYALKNNYDKTQEVKRKINEQLKKENRRNLIFWEKELLKKLSDEYRQIPKEKNADIFALSQIEKALEIYRTHYVN